MLELRILTGLHRGATLPLDSGAIRIGCGTRNDIVLLDPGMPEHVGILVHTLERTASSEPEWRYRPSASAQTNAGPAAGAAASDGFAISAGTRWFAGPVLLGCDEEDTPWPVESVPTSAPLPQARRLSTKAKLGMTIIAAVAVFALAAMLAARAAHFRTASSLTAGPSASIAHDPAKAPTPSHAETPSVRVAKALVYPGDAVPAPPFSIRRAVGGAYGFLVTDDGQTLVPGSRWKSFTLVRIEPGRAIFTGPHDAELRW